MQKYGYKRKKIMYTNQRCRMMIFAENIVTYLTIYRHFISLIFSCEPYVMLVHAVNLRRRHSGDVHLRELSSHRTSESLQTRSAGNTLPATGRQFTDHVVHYPHRAYTPIITIGLIVIRCENHIGLTSNSYFQSRRVASELQAKPFLQ